MSRLERDQQRAIVLIGVGFVLGAVGLGAALLTAAWWFYLFSYTALNFDEVKHDILPGMYISFHLDANPCMSLTTWTELSSSNLPPPMASFSLDNLPCSIHGDNLSTALNVGTWVTTPTDTGSPYPTVNDLPANACDVCDARLKLLHGELDKLRLDIAALREGQTLFCEDLLKLMRNELVDIRQEKAADSTAIAALMKSMTSTEALMKTNDKKQKLKIKQLESTLRNKLEAQSIDPTCIVEKSLHESKQAILPMVGNIDIRLKDLKYHVDTNTASSLKDLADRVNEMYNITQEYVEKPMEAHEALVQQINTNDAAVENTMADHRRQLKQLSANIKHLQIEETSAQLLRFSVVQLESKIANLIDRNSFDSTVVPMKNFIEEWDPVLLTLVCRNDLKHGVKNAVSVASRKVDQELHTVWTEIGAITAYAKTKLAVFEQYDCYFQILHHHQCQLGSDTAELDQVLANSIVRVNDLEARLCQLERAGHLSGKQRVQQSPPDVQGFYNTML
jgi:hypothetical protein